MALAGNSNYATVMPATLATHSSRIAPANALLQIYLIKIWASYLIAGRIGWSPETTAGIYYAKISLQPQGDR